MAGSNSNMSKRKKKRVNLTLNEGILEYANQLIEKRHYSNIVDLVEDLLRSEYERRFGSAVIAEPKEANSPPRSSARRAAGLAAGESYPAPES